MNTTDEIREIGTLNPIPISSILVHDAGGIIMTPRQLDNNGTPIYVTDVSINTYRGQISLVVFSKEPLLSTEYISDLSPPRDI